VKVPEKVKPTLDAAVKIQELPPTDTLPGAETTPGAGGDIVITKIRRRALSERGPPHALIEGSRRTCEDQELAPDAELRIRQLHAVSTAIISPMSVLDHRRGAASWARPDSLIVVNGYSRQNLLLAAPTTTSARRFEVQLDVDKCEIVPVQAERLEDNKQSDLNRRIYDIWLRTRTRGCREPAAWILGPCRLHRGRVSKGRKITDFKSFDLGHRGYMNLRRAGNFSTRARSSPWTRGPLERTTKPPSCRFLRPLPVRAAPAQRQVRLRHRPT